MWSRWLVSAALGAGGCAPSARLAAPDAEVPVLLGRPPVAGTQVRVAVGRRAPMKREENLPEMEPLAQPDDEERLRVALRAALRDCSRCVVYLPWIDARLEWMVLLGKQTSALESRATVVGGESAP